MVLKVWLKIHTFQVLHEWLSGGVSPCQGEGRGFESRLVLKEKSSIYAGSQRILDFFYACFMSFSNGFSNGFLLDKFCL